MFASFFSKSVAVILKDFEAIVAKLKAAEEHHRAKAAGHIEDAAVSADKAAEATAEADQAAQAATKIQALIS